jgi:hypothetical protein
MTPFEVVYGKNPLLVTSYLPRTSKVQAVDHTLHTREATLCILKDNLVMALLKTILCNRGYGVSSTSKLQTNITKRQNTSKN